MQGLASLRLSFLYKHGSSLAFENMHKINNFEIFFVFYLHHILQRYFMSL